MSASAVIAKLLSLATLAKGISAKAGNGLVLADTDGLYYVPVGYGLLKSEFFASTSLVSNGGGWTKVANAKWVVVIVVGGAGAGYCVQDSVQGLGGGEAGALEVWSGWATDLPAMADVMVGAGGAAPTGYLVNNDGSASTFGTLVRASGGRGGGNADRRITVSGVRVRPISSYPIGAPGSDASITSTPEDTTLGPGSGGGEVNGVWSGTRGGASSLARPASTRAGGVVPTASGQSPGAGTAAIAGDPWSFGSGGSGGNGNYGIAGGAGGAPGGGGGAGYYNTGSGTVKSLPGAGARGEVRVLTYG